MGQIQKRKQKRREPTTEELQSELREQSERDVLKRIKQLLGETAVVEHKIEEVIGDE